jgi:manganese-dependent inorganic pyrophosphatase
MAPLVYVTGHRNPDLDSIGSAIGYAELKGRVDREATYVPVRLGNVNAQTAWALERSGAAEPDFLAHVHLRVCDVMRRLVVTARADEPVRHVGLRMAEQEVDLVPVVDQNGALTGVLTERELARQYIRESRGASSFDERPVRLEAIADVLGGEVICGEDREVKGRLWVIAMEVPAMEGLVQAGDTAVVGDRVDAQRRALEIGVAVLVIAHGNEVDPEILELAREKGAGVVTSPLDSYVTGRLIGLAVPCGAIMSGDPPSAEPDDLLADVTEKVIESRAVFALDEAGAPIGIVTRSDLVGPPRRQVLLVDHAEQAQSVAGVENADIVEILDHHHIGSIETHVPVMATFDPVGSTATLVVERFRREGREPQPSTATMLLAALLSDTVVLSSPTTTRRDERVVEYLEELLGLEAETFGMEMFESTSDVSGLPAADVIARDAKEYHAASGDTLCIAQIETVGNALRERTAELLEALEKRRVELGHALYALMVTDIVEKGTDLLVAGNFGPVERAFGTDAQNGVVPLPGVMSRKKQVAPKLLSAL